MQEYEIGRYLGGIFMNKCKATIRAGAVLVSIAAGIWIADGNGMHSKQNKITTNPVVYIEEMVPNKQDYEALLVEESTMHKGDLILVNNEQPYEFNEEHTLISIFDEKSSSYLVKDKNVMVAEHIIPHLNQMLDEFYREMGEKKINVISGFRTKEYQQVVYDRNVEENGAAYAMKYVANAGYSEHHTGLAMDFGCYDPKSGASSSFDGKGKLRWILENAYRYGFVLRYQKEKEDLTGIAYESWHFRYVGVPHSYVMEKKGRCLEEYLTYVKNFSFGKKHLKVEADGKQYEIYYCKEGNVRVPKDKEYTISGDNIEGYIITVNV